MVDRENGDRRTEDRWPIDVPGVLEIGAAEVPGVEDLREEIGSIVDGTRPDASAIEDTLSGVPVLEDTEVDASALPGGSPLSTEEADAVIEAGEEAVTLSVEAGEDAATVLLDAGDEAFEVVIGEGGEVAGEVVAEALAAALEGV